MRHLLAINPKVWLRVKQMWGVEEPASAFFSFAIVLVFLYQGWKLRPLLNKAFGKKTKDDSINPSNNSNNFNYIFPSEIRSDAIIIPITFGVWVGCYLGSTIFHIHETKLTEKIDYFGAALGWSWMLFVAMYFTFRLAKSHDKSTRFPLPSPRVKIFLAALPLVMFDIYYIRYMTFFSFDYGWHVITVGVKVLLHFALYLLWIGLNRRRSYSFFILCAHLLMGAACPLEIYDFAPLYGHFDGHSLWHFFGAIISWCYCIFLRQHLEWEMRLAGTRGGAVEAKSTV